MASSKEPPPLCCPLGLVQGTPLAGSPSYHVRRRQPGPRATGQTQVQVPLKPQQQVAGRCPVRAGQRGRLGWQKPPPPDSAEWITKNHVSRGLTNEKSTLNPDILPLHIYTVLCSVSPPPHPWSANLGSVIPACPGGCGVHSGGRRRLPIPRPVLGLQVPLGPSQASATAA